MLLQNADCKPIPNKQTPSYNSMCTIALACHRSRALLGQQASLTDKHGLWLLLLALTPHQGTDIKGVEAYYQLAIGWRYSMDCYVPDEAIVSTSSSSTGTSSGSSSGSTPGSFSQDGNSGSDSSSIDTGLIPLDSGVIVGGNYNDPCACTNPCDTKAFSQCSFAGKGGVCTPLGGATCPSHYKTVLGTIAVCCTSSSPMAGAASKQVSKAGSHSDSSFSFDPCACASACNTGLSQCRVAGKSGVCTPVGGAKCPNHYVTVDNKVAVCCDGSSPGGTPGYSGYINYDACACKNKCDKGSWSQCKFAGKGGVCEPVGGKNCVEHYTTVLGTVAVCCN